MPKEYRIIEEVASPIMLIRSIQGVTYNEMGEIELVNGERRCCRVLETDDGNAMVQLYEAPTSISLDSSKVRFLGRIAELGVSGDMLSRIFDGMGKPIDGGSDILPEKHMDISGLSMNPAARSYPEEFIQTGVSAIDGPNTLVRGRKLPIFSAFDLPYANLAVQITCQAEVRDTDEFFIVVFTAMGITFEEANFFMESFREAGVIDRGIMSINLANDLAVERIATPRMALTTAEYPALEKNIRALVILTDITNYADSLCEIPAARKEISGRRDYPGYMYTDLASLYGRAGCQKGKNGFTTMIPVPTMLEDDKTHLVPDFTDYITGGQIILSCESYRKNVTPPIDVSPSLSRPKDKGIGEGETRADHTDVTNQPFAAYVYGKDTKELMITLDETALADTDKLYAEFADEFERGYISQDYYTDCDIEETMEIGWKLLRILPRSELKRIKDKFLDLYYEAKQLAVTARQG